MKQFSIYDTSNRTHFIFTHWSKGTYSSQSPQLTVVTYFLPPLGKKIPAPSITLSTESLYSLTDSVRAGIKSEQSIQAENFFSLDGKSYLVFSSVAMPIREIRLEIHSPLASVEVPKLYLRAPDFEIFLSQLEALTVEENAEASEIE